MLKWSAFRFIILAVTTTPPPNPHESSTQPPSPSHRHSTAQPRPLHNPTSTTLPALSGILGQAHALASMVSSATWYQSGTPSTIAMALIWLAGDWVGVNGHELLRNCGGKPVDVTPFYCRMISAMGSASHGLRAILATRPNN